MSPPEDFIEVDLDKNADLVASPGAVIINDPWDAPDEPDDQHESWKGG